MACQALELRTRVETAARDSGLASRPPSTTSSRYEFGASSVPVPHSAVGNAPHVLRPVRALPRGSTHARCWVVDGGTRLESECALST